MTKTSWWKNGVVGSLPWLLVPPGVAGIVAFIIAQQPALQATAEARIDALATLAGAPAGLGLAWSMLRAYRRKNEASDSVEWRRPNWVVLAVAIVGIGLGVLAADSAASHRATSHYGPESSRWTTFVSGCVKNCRQSSGDAQLCDPYCTCTARTYFEATVMVDVDQDLNALADKGPNAGDVQQRLEHIGKTCASTIGG